MQSFRSGRKLMTMGKVSGEPVQLYILGGVLVATCPSLAHVYRVFPPTAPDSLAAPACLVAAPAGVCRACGRAAERRARVWSLLVWPLPRRVIASRAIPARHIFRELSSRAHQHQTQSIERALDRLVAALLECCERRPQSDRLGTCDDSLHDTFSRN